MGYMMSMKVLLDLLFKNSQYQLLVERAIDLLNSEKRLEELPPWFFDISVVAAYRMVSSELPLVKQNL